MICGWQRLVHQKDPYKDGLVWNFAMAVSTFDGDGLVANNGGWSAAACLDWPAELGFHVSFGLWTTAARRGTCPACHALAACLESVFPLLALLFRAYAQLDGFALLRYLILWICNAVKLSRRVPVLPSHFGWFVSGTICNGACVGLASYGYGNAALVAGVAASLLPVLLQTLPPEGHSVGASIFAEENQPAIDAIELMLRTPDGKCKLTSELDAADSGAVKKALGEGGHGAVLVHVVAGCKTGHHMPSMACVRELLEQHGERAIPVLDACQTRMADLEMRDLIAAGLAYGGLFGTFALAPDGTHEWYQVDLAEILHTFMLCFVALNVVAEKCPQYFGLAIGSVPVAVVIDVSHVLLGGELYFTKGMVLSVATSLMCMIFAPGSVSGRHFNPAATRLAATGRPEVLMPSDWGKYTDAQLVGGIAVAHRRLALYAGLAFGSCVTAGGYAIGGASSGLLDPAVSFGVAFQFRAVSHYVKAGAAGDTLLNAF